MAYDRASRFFGATQFSVVQVDPTWMVQKLTAMSGACSQFGVQVTVEEPTLTTPGQMIVDLSEISDMSSFDLAVIGRSPNDKLSIPMDSIRWNMSDGKIIVNLEVPLGSVNNALTYNIATAQPA